MSALSPQFVARIMTSDGGIAASVGRIAASGGGIVTSAWIPCRR